MGTNREKLWRIVNERSLITGQDMTLSTGASSTFYFDCKKTTLDGQGLALLADAYLEEIDALSTAPMAIGGLTLGADPIVAAVALRAYQTGRPTVNACIVRKEPKTHGTKSHIENEMPEGTPIVVVDDVITSGSSTAQACERFLADKYVLVGIVALVDREAGGRQRLEEKYGCPVRAVFVKSDFPRIREDVGSISKAAVGA